MDGNWTIQHGTTTQDPGSCLFSGDPGSDTATILDNGDGTASLSLNGLQGSCTAKIAAGCKLVAPCSLANGTLQISWTISGDKLSGSETIDVHPSGKPACHAESADTGTKK